MARELKVVLVHLRMQNFKYEQIQQIYSTLTIGKFNARSFQLQYMTHLRSSHTKIIQK